MPETSPPRRIVTVSDQALAERYARGCVILVDDEEDIRIAYASLIEIQGYACETHVSATDFLAALHANRPRFPGPVCVLCDVNMPELDGLELQRHLEKYPEMPLIFISGSSGLQEAVTGFRAGALDFLIKPVDAGQLYAAVARALALSTERRHQSQRESELAARLATLSARELEIARQIVRGWTNREVSEALGIAERTVKLHRQRAMRKLDAATLADLVRLIDAAESHGTQH